MNVNISFPLREVAGAKWCSLANMGIKAIDIVAYDIRIREKYSFAGGHRHKYATAKKDIHILFPDDTYEVALDIREVRPKSPPKRRHDR